MGWHNTIHSARVGTGRNAAGLKTSGKSCEKMMLGILTRCFSMLI